jgi:type II secretory pathway pseudopilin PulG
MVRRRNGFALIDVIIGSSMLAIGLAVVISMSSRSLSRQANAQQQITASWLADELLAMALVVGPEEYAKAYPRRGRFDPPFEAFSYDLALEDKSLYLPIKAVATISWEASSGMHSIAIETLIARLHGEPVPRAPAEVVDREQRYWEAIEAREGL